jgi:uncharacterized protein with GYD domain
LTTTETGSIVFDPSKAAVRRGVRLMGSPFTKGAVKDEVTYFFLITLTERGAVLPAAQRKKERSAISKFVKKEGGRCHVYSTRGAPFDSVSVITGITTAAAVRIAEEIGKRGTVKVTLIAGIEMFD